MANYININNADVLEGAQFVVDTQVIYWFFYAPDTPCSYDIHKIDEYSSFMDAIVNKGKMIVTSNVLNELFKIIERNEYTLYLEINNYSKEDVTIKKYRLIEEERESVKQKLNLVFEQIRAVASIVYDCDNIDLSQQFITEFHIHKADYVDYSLVRYCEHSQINNILTDDADFKTIHNSLNIYSANPKFFR